MGTDAPLRIHLVRHARIASHSGDTPITEEGRRQAEAAGRRLYEELVAGEAVSLLYAPTRRARETAGSISSTLSELLENRDERQFRLLAPAEHGALRNPDLYIAGVRVEMVSTAEALVEQLPRSCLSREEVAHLPFLHGFWSDPDRVGFWVRHPNPPGEDADTVARRLLTFFGSLLDIQRIQPRRYICVSHSPVMRAFLRRYLLEYDPGEPDYLESIDVYFTRRSDPLWSPGSCRIRYRENSKEIQL